MERIQITQQGNVQLVYTFDLSFMPCEMDDSRIGMICNSLSEFFRKIDKVAEHPGKLWDIDANNDKKVTVTMETGGYKVTATKRGSCIEILAAKKPQEKKRRASDEIPFYKNYRLIP